MKITQNSTGSNIKNVNSAREKGSEGSERLKDPSASSGVADSVRVNMSDRAQNFQKAKEVASRQTVDEAKVARLQKLIDEGKYQVNAEAVADRLVDEQMKFPS